MLYGYARCSTNETKQDIQRQVRELQNRGVSDENIYLEYESGTKEDRREFQKVLHILEEGDILIATEVSRLTRSTRQLCNLLEYIKEKKVCLEVGSFLVDCRKELDPMTEGMLKMMGVFAELERNMISQRVKSGMSNAKSKGAKIGRPRITSDAIPSKFMKYYPKFLDGEITKTELAALSGISKPTVYKYLTLLGHKKKTIESQ